MLEPVAATNGAAALKLGVAAREPRRARPRDRRVQGRVGDAQRPRQGRGARPHGGGAGRARHGGSRRHGRRGDRRRPGGRRGPRSRSALAKVAGGQGRTRRSRSRRRPSRPAAERPRPRALAHAQEAKGDMAGSRGDLPPGDRSRPEGARARDRPRHRAAQDGTRRRGRADAGEGDRGLAGRDSGVQGDGAGQDRAEPRAGRGRPTPTSPPRWPRTTPRRRRCVIEVKAASALQALGAGQVDLAVQDLMQLRDANPDSAAVRLALGKAQVARRDVAAAIAELQKAVELEPEERRGAVPARQRAAAHEGRLAGGRRAVPEGRGARARQRAVRGTGLGAALVGRAAVRPRRSTC